MGMPISSDHLLTCAALCCARAQPGLKAEGPASKTLFFPTLSGGRAAPLSPTVRGHAAVPNSISSRSQVWILEGLEAGQELAAGLPAKTGTNFLFIPRSSQKPLVVVAVSPCPLAFPHLTGNHTTQGKECLGVGGRRTALGDPAPPLPQTLSPAASQVRLSHLTQQPLPSRTRAEGWRAAPQPLQPRIQGHC